VILLRDTVHARFIQLLHCMIVVSPPFTCTFFYCVYNSYTLIRSFAALPHLNFAGISLEFYLYWHMVAWIINISVDIYRMDSWKFHSLHITGYGKNRVHRFQWYLSLHIVIALACCALWTCDCWNSMGYTNGIHTFSPLLSKYGVYNISLLIVLAHTVNCVLCTSIFISLCGFVPWLGVWTHY